MKSKNTQMEISHLGGQFWAKQRKQKWREIKNKQSTPYCIWAVKTLKPSHWAWDSMCEREDFAPSFSEVKWPKSKQSLSFNFLFLFFFFSPFFSWNKMKPINHIQRKNKKIRERKIENFGERKMIGKSQRTEKHSTGMKLTPVSKILRWGPLKTLLFFFFFRF